MSFEGHFPVAWASEKTEVSIPDLTTFFLILKVLVSLFAKTRIMTATQKKHVALCLAQSRYSTVMVGFSLPQPDYMARCF